MGLVKKVHAYLVDSGSGDTFVNQALVDFCNNSGCDCTDNGQLTRLHAKILFKF